MMCGSLVNWVPLTNVPLRDAKFGNGKALGIIADFGVMTRYLMILQNEYCCRALVQW
jgi:hypothetical protein